MAPITKMRIHHFAARECCRPTRSSRRYRRWSGAGRRARSQRQSGRLQDGSGKYPAVKDDRLPYSLGRDLSGVVEKCGAQGCQVQARGRGVRHGEHLWRRLRRESRGGRAHDRRKAFRLRSRPCRRYPAGRPNRLAGTVSPRTVEGRPDRADSWRVRRRRSFYGPVRQGQGRPGDRRFRPTMSTSSASSAPTW